MSTASRLLSLTRTKTITRNPSCLSKRLFSTTFIRRDALLDATESVYKNHISTVKNKLIIVDFYEQWCPPCRLLSPLLERVESDPTIIGAPESSIDLITLDGDKTPKLFQEYRIKAVPTVMAFYNEKQVGQFLGAKKLEDLKEWYTGLKPALK